MTKEPDRAPSSEELAAAFSAIIEDFVAKRRKYGGILLPDEQIIDGAWFEAMVKAGWRKRPERTAYTETASGLILPAKADE